jgi:heptaprenyl diphosphate synthase
MKKTQKMIFISVLVAQALVLHIIERSIPVPFIAPGAKLGLSNIITVIALYTLGFRSAFSVIMLRIFLTTLIGGPISSMFYSLAGGILSLISMHAMKELGKANVSIIGVSMVGAFFHNLGQVIVAGFIIQNINIIFYLPILTVAGMGTGFFVGITCSYLIILLMKLPIYNILKN